MIAWPAIIKYSGENELSFISSQAEWDNDADLNCFTYEPEDILVDSNGLIYGLLGKQNNLVFPTLDGNSIELETINELVKMHASQLGSCCISKLSFQSISAAINAVGEIEANE